MVALARARFLPIGVHLGANQVSLVQLAGSPGNYEVHALARGDLMIDENAAAEDQDRDVAQILRKLVCDHPFKGRQVVSCLGSQQLFVQNVRLPKLPAEEVEKVVRWEAEERLPYPVTDAEIRYLLAGEVRQDANIKQEVILMACHQGVIQRHIHVLEQAGLVPQAIDVEPCALLRSLRPDCDGPGGGPRTVYLHLSDRATAAVIADGQQVLFLKHIATGGVHLDLAVARHLNVPPQEAARMRAMVSSADQLDPEDEVHRSTLEAIRTPLENLCGEVELCLRYYKVTFRGQPLDRIVLSGTEACPWLAEYLADRFGMKCDQANPFEFVRGAGSQGGGSRPARWATAIGLSLKPLQEE